MTQVKDTFKSMEMLWKESLPRYTNKEWVQLFPEILSLLPEKIACLETEKELVHDAILSKLSYIKENVRDDFAYFFCREWVKWREGSQLLAIEKELSNLRSYLKIEITASTSKDNTWEEKVHLAAEVPIEGVISRFCKLSKCGKYFRGLCPFHSESNPSFVVYPLTNSCWCFGCNKGGDVINFVRLYLNMRFSEAVKYLLKD